MSKCILLQGRPLIYPSALTVLVGVAFLVWLSPTVGYSQTAPLDLREQVEGLLYERAPAADQSSSSAPNQAATTASDKAELPPFPNPYVSLLPKPAPDSHYEAWEQYLRQRAQLQRANARQAAAEVIEEQEENDSLASAQPINLDSRSEQNRRLIRGVSGPDSLEFTQKFAFGQEDDGAISSANEVVFDQLFQTVTYIAAIGDGPFGSLGSGSGDFDYYQLDLAEGETVEARIAGSDSLGNFIPVVAIIDEDRNIFSVTLDNPLNPLDGVLKFTAPEEGQYYALVLDVVAPEVPDVSDSGSGMGAGGEGVYRLDLSLIEETDADFFTFQLEAGDVLGAAINGRSLPSLRIFSDSGELLVGAFDPSTFPLEESPLPADGQTTVNLVVPEGGQYFIEVAQNVGPYELELVAARPGLEQTPGRKQVLYIDFTGAEFDPGEVFGGGPTGVVELSPFGDFLPAWGVEDNPSQRVRLAKRIVATVRENVEKDLRGSGVNPNFEVEVVSDFGLPQLAKRLERTLARADDPVSRVIVGGTIEESGIPTIGLAESIDPGNFATEETAIVLLDILSAPGTPGASADTSFTLNDVRLAPGKTIEDVLAVGLGNIVSHEAGHYLGNYHVDGLNDTSTIMDEGPGGLFNLVGIGPSGVFGAEDQIDVDFVEDTYSTLEGLLGENDTQANTAFGLTFIPVGDTSLIAIRSDQADIADVRAGARLSQSYPNPQAPGQPSQIGFTPPARGTVSLDIYDIRGKQVTNLFSGAAEAGKVHQVTLDAQQLKLKRGVYIYKLTTAEGELEKRFVITE